MGIFRRIKLHSKTKAFVKRMKHAIPLALDGAELVTLGEAECVELRLEVDGLG